MGDIFRTTTRLANTSNFLSQNPTAHNQSLHISRLPRAISTSINSSAFTLSISCNLSSLRGRRPYFFLSVSASPPSFSPVVYRTVLYRLRWRNSLTRLDSSTLRSLAFCNKIDQSFIMGTVQDPVDSNEYCIPVEAKEILKSMASKWEDVLDANALQVIPLKGAMTNEVFEIKWPTKTDESSRKVLVRIYGEGVDAFFDRNNEIQTFEFMSKQEQGPQLLGRFSNGRIEEFIHARTLSASDLHDPDISARIAVKLKEFHGLNTPAPKNIFLWDRMQNWLKTAKTLSPPEEAQSFHLDTLEEEISLLEKELSGDQRIGFCHNDLQYGNIMIDEEAKSVIIIDYEYSSYNPVAFDIANHFCEMAADYHTETPHILDFNKYPGLEERRRFVLAYLSSLAVEPVESEVEQLLMEVEKYTLASHLTWALWGIISEHVNDIDFDYIEYARQRFEQYWSRKSELLATAEASSPEAIADDMAGDHQELAKGGGRVSFFRKFKKYISPLTRRPSK